MSWSPELLSGDLSVKKFVKKSREDARTVSYTAAMPWDGKAEIRREGKYPINSHQGRFETTLWRTIPQNNETERVRGGGFRIMANKHLSSESAFLQERVQVIVDTIPAFLKELSDSEAQKLLSQARERVSNAEFPAALVQNRSSDTHSGEYRTTPDGQHDLQEEIWYAKVLRVMKRFSGISYSEAARLLVACGEKPFFSDYGLGFATMVQEFFGKIPQNVDIEVIPISQFFKPFPSNIEQEANSHEERCEIVRSIIEEFKTTHPDRMELQFGTFVGETLADYPIIQDGVEFRSRLVSIRKEGEKSFQTFRILQCGDQDNCYLRIDSICINGIQGGDTHCDCEKQTLAEKKRAQLGLPMMLINLRDDEGKFHGEGDKGGTLWLQRAINAYLIDLFGPEEEGIGNAIASQLFYGGTGKEPDARSYDYVTALISYLKIQKIPHFVTNNEQKKKALSRVCEIVETVDAKIYEGLTPEAHSTINEKFSGFVPNVAYR